MRRTSPPNPETDQTPRPRLRARAVVAVLALGALLAACSHTDIGPGFTEDARAMDPAAFECCFEPEKFYPALPIRLALALGPALGPRFSAKAYGGYEDEEYPGRLTGKAEAHAALISRARPLDIMVIGNTSYMLGRLVPGRFSHSLIYLGSEAELRAAGLWYTPALVPHHDAIRAGARFIDAASPAVQLRSLARAFEVDRAVLMRPALTRDQQARALSHVLGVLGEPFSYTFEVEAEVGQSCTGMIQAAMPSMVLERRAVYGMDVIMPDDVVAQAIRGEGLEVLGYLVGDDTPEGYALRSTYALMVDIAAFWGVPGK